MGGKQSRNGWKTEEANFDFRDSSNVETFVKTEKEDILPDHSHIGETKKKEEGEEQNASLNTDNDRKVTQD